GWRGQPVPEIARQSTTGRESAGSDRVQAAARAVVVLNRHLGRVRLADVIAAGRAIQRRCHDPYDDGFGAFDLRVIDRRDVEGYVRDYGRQQHRAAEM